MASQVKKARTEGGGGAEDDSVRVEKSLSRVAPRNPLVTPLLTDMYQITMAYAYWRAGRHEEVATFELFFRKCPFHGEFTVFAGMDQVVAFLEAFKFTQEDVDYLEALPGLAGCDPGFFAYLLTLDCGRAPLTVEALPEGTVCFPRCPLLTVTGPLALGQLLETTLLNLVNYPSLLATNAARMRIAAGPGKQLLEFGLRRAQGPDGGCSASRYAFVGGFDGTSNVAAGKMGGLPVSGTHAHAFVQSYTGFNKIRDPMLAPAPRKGDGGGGGGPPVDFVAKVKEVRAGGPPEWGAANDSELAAFVAYALAFPNAFLALVDTYDTLHSGLPNFIVTALALAQLGYTPKGIRLDSGDLAYLSLESRAMMDAAADKYGCPALKHCKVVASNDINEHVLLSLKNQGHAIDAFGIGTHLVTCQAQPALGCVYKLCAVGGEARIKLSQDIAKVMIPGQKEVYRLFGKGEHPLVDLIARKGEPPPKPGVRVLCRHPFQESARCHVVPTRVERLLGTVWEGKRGEEGSQGCVAPAATPEAARAYCLSQMAMMRADMTRPVNPTPYKVSVSGELYAFLHDMWQQNLPIRELE